MYGKFGDGWSVGFLSYMWQLLYIQGIGSYCDYAIH